MAFKRSFSSMLAALAAVGALLAACGGGDTVVPFEATRMVAFGDELSVIEQSGRKYTVNGMTPDTPPVLDCELHPLWVQVVASGFGMVFPQCNPDATPSPRGEIRATVGAKVADLKLQVDEFLASGAPTEKDLATMLVGMHDVLELYARHPAESRESLIELARQRGREFADQVNRVAFAGPAVIVSTLPDIGLTPFGLAAGPESAQLLGQLSDAVNEGLRVNMVQDGRLAGIVFADAMVELGLARRLPGISGDERAIREGVCKPEVVLPNCDNLGGENGFLVENGTASGWVWADSLRPGPTVHLFLGQQALSRARNNPF